MVSTNVGGKLLTFPPTEKLVISAARLKTKGIVGFLASPNAVLTVHGYAQMLPTLHFTHAAVCNTKSYKVNHAHAVANRTQCHLVPPVVMQDAVLMEVGFVPALQMGHTSAEV